jgi:hypothetical protein
MDFLDKQIAPPASWTKFEDLSRSLFAAIWRDKLAQKNGRAGQAQSGVDVYGRPADRNDRTYGVQCKGKMQSYGAKATRKEVLAELALAETFEPALGHWTFATTAPNDARLQAFVRDLSQRRVSEGRFPIDIVGWETILALLAEHPDVIEQHYPEHGRQLPQLLAEIKTLVAGANMISAGANDIEAQSADWEEVRFEGARDLGPALLGRPLGPADIHACPELPEAHLVLAELHQAFSSRLTGVAGAGKSVCALQSAARAKALGMRVVKLRNPVTSGIRLTTDHVPTLHLIDDAHLTDPAALRTAEQSTHAAKWLLTTHTASSGQEDLSGAIRLRSGVRQFEA